MTAALLDVDPAGSFPGDRPGPVPVMDPLPRPTAPVDVAKWRDRCGSADLDVESVGWLDPLGDDPDAEFWDAVYGDAERAFKRWLNDGADLTMLTTLAAVYGDADDAEAAMALLGVAYVEAVDIVWDMVIDYGETTGQVTVTDDGDVLVRPAAG